MRWLIAIVAIFVIPVSAQPFWHDRIFVVPAPKCEGKSTEGR